MNFFSLLKRNFLYKFKKKTNIDLQANIDISSLDKLFSFYNTDKANVVDGGRVIGHGFSMFYEKHLNYLRNAKINILEIGSFSGASAAAFAKYFPKAEIYCLDVNLLHFKFASSRIHEYGMDISNQKMMNKFLNKINFFDKILAFDFIIDDGSHIQSEQLIALNFFYKFVKSSGFYIIEDYKFSNYFKHLNDVDDLKIDEVINNINNKKNFKSKFLSDETIKTLLKDNIIIYEHKGNTKNSDIVFFKKN